MDNPWLNLPHRSPYVLREDAGAIRTFNERASADHLIRLELMPEPFLGSPDAPIILLNLNPGFSEYDHLLVDDAYGREQSVRNLSHQPIDYPFYLLDPQLAFAPGAKWWRERLGALLRIASAEVVANLICCIEFFPYHSRKYRDLKGILNSQRYSFHLVEEAIKRDAIIVAMRSTNRWLNHVSGLGHYEQFHVCKNWQRPYISRGNLPNIFSEIEHVTSRMGIAAGDI